METNYLLDTHTFLWAANDADVFRLGKNAKAAIENTETDIFVSSASLYEISNKCRIGKLPEYKKIADNIFDALYGLGAKELPLDWEQSYLAGSMEWEHKDPFDRMLAAQAQTEGMTLITCDKVFADVPGVDTLW